MVGHIERLRGFARHMAIGDAFRAYLEQGHLDSAEVLLGLASSEQSNSCLEFLAEAYAQLGDLARASAFADRASGMSRTLAWEGVCRTLARAGRCDEAEALAFDHVKASWAQALMNEFIVWARALHGESDPMPRRRQIRGSTARASSLCKAALGALAIDPWRGLYP